MLFNISSLICPSITLFNFFHLIQNNLSQVHLEKPNIYITDYKEYLHIPLNKISFYKATRKLNNEQIILDISESA